LILKLADFKASFLLSLPSLTLNIYINPTHIRRCKTMSEQATQQTPELGVQDLQAVLQVIEVASTRGAFKGGELSAVGQLFDKINGFVTAFTKQAEETAAANDAQQAATPAAGE
jgi:hypothetical protein